MTWTKRRSAAARAAKARKRMSNEVPEEMRGSVYVPKRPRARFSIQIRDHAIGDSLTLNLHASPWRNQWICEQGQFSSAKLGRAIGLIVSGGVT